MTSALQSYNHHECLLRRKQSANEGLDDVSAVSGSVFVEAEIEHTHREFRLGQKWPPQPGWCRLSLLVGLIDSLFVQPWQHWQTLQQTQDNSKNC